MKRSTQSMLSLIGVPLGVVTPKATVSAPCSRRRASSFAAISSSAPSQPTRIHPGSAAPFGAVRRIG
jgi:hypothetical protein